MKLTEEAARFGLSYNQVVHSTHDAFYTLIYPFTGEERELLIGIRRKGKNRVSMNIRVTVLIYMHYVTVDIG